jgi:hypothetical protein
MLQSAIFSAASSSLMPRSGGSKKWSVQVRLVNHEFSDPQLWGRGQAYTAKNG